MNLPKFDKAFTRQFSLFLVTSGFAAGINILSRIILSKFLTYEIAIFIAYLIGMLTAYVLTRKYVFETSGQSVQREMAGFVLINIIAVIQVWCVSVGLYRWGLPIVGWTWNPSLSAHVIGVLSPAFTSYFGHKYVSFRKIDP